MQSVPAPAAPNIMLMEAVGEHDRGRAPLRGHLEREHGEVEHLLRGGGGERERLVAAVAAALDGGSVVALLGVYVAEAGAGAVDVYDDGGQLRAREIADALLHEREAGAGRGRHAELACAGGAEHHVDRGGFAFGLHEGVSFNL